jgi:hypothetical protein
MTAQLAADPDSYDDVAAAVNGRLDSPDVTALIAELYALAADAEAQSRRCPPSERCAPLGFMWDIYPGMPPSQRAAAEAMFTECAAGIAWSMKQLGLYTSEQFRVGLDPATTPPIFAHRRRMPQVHEEEILRVVSELQRYGIVILAPDDCRYASALVVAPKKDADGMVVKWRVCVDYRPINAVTPPERYPMLLPEDIFTSRTADRTSFRRSTSRLPSTRRRFTRTTGTSPPSTGRYEYVGSPFGFKRLPAFFQRIVEREFKDLAPPFIDDMLRGDVIPDTPETPWGTDISAHIASTRAILLRCIRSGFTLAAEKVHFGYPSVNHLGHTVSKGCYRAMMSKVQAILAIQPPG